MSVARFAEQFRRSLTAAHEGDLDRLIDHNRLAVGSALLILANEMACAEDKRDRLNELVRLAVKHQGRADGGWRVPPAVAPDSGTSGDLARLLKRYGEFDAAACRRRTGALSLMNEAGGLFQKGDPLAARSKLRVAERMVESIQDTALQASILQQFALIAQSEGEPAKAVEYLYEACKLHQSIDDPLGVVNDLTTLGSVRAELDDAAARATFLSAVELAEALGETGLRCRNLSNLAALAVQNRRIEAAFAYLEQAAGPLDSPERLALRAQVARETALLWGQARNYDRRIAEHDRATQFWRELDMEGQATVETALKAQALTALGRWSAAEDAYRQVLAFEKAADNANGVAAALSDMAMLNAAKGEWIKAASLYKDALKVRQQLGDHLGAAADLVNLGIVYARQDQWDPALRRFSEAVRIHRDLGDIRSEIDDRLNAALARLQSGSPSEALTDLGVAGDLAMQLRQEVIGDGTDREVIFSVLGEIVRGRVAALIKQGGDPLTALRELERFRARCFLDLPLTEDFGWIGRSCESWVARRTELRKQMAANRARSMFLRLATTSDPEEGKRQQEAVGNLARLMQIARDEYLRLDTPLLKEGSGQWAKYLSKLDDREDAAAGLEALARSLRPKQRVLSFMVGQSSIEGWLVQPAGDPVVHFTAPLTPEALAYGCGRIARAYAGREPWPADTLKVFGPKLFPREIVSKIPREASLVIIADAAMQSLPFEMLRIQDGDAEENLQDRVCVSYSPSLYLLIEQLEREQERLPPRTGGEPHALSLMEFRGDGSDPASGIPPVFADLARVDSPSPLGEDIESRIIAAVCDHVPAEQVVRRAGSAATRDSLSRVWDAGKVLHLSLPGYSETGNGGLLDVLLAARGAPSPGSAVDSDAVIHIDEIPPMGSLRHTEMAALPRCSLSVGPSSAGCCSAVRAFLLAGARTVLVNQGRRDPVAGGLICGMTYAWTLDRNNRLPPAAALRRAKSAMTRMTESDIQRVAGLSTEQWQDYLRAYHGVGRSESGEAPLLRSETPFAEPVHWAGWRLFGEGG